MSAIDNNILWHATKTTPEVSVGNVVLSSFSIGLRGRYENGEDLPVSDRVLGGFSVGLRSRYSDPTELVDNRVMRTLSVGYIGWPYQGSSQSYTPPTGSYSIIHHK